MPPKTPNTNHRLLTCQVMHNRLRPKKHHFSYNLFWFALRLDAPTSNGFLRTGWQWRGWPGYGFYQQDHFPGMPGTLMERLASLLQAEGITLPPDAQVTLVTQCRLLGYGFNPVCFWFCAQPDGTPLAIVVEVQNTFLEVKPYVLTQPDANGCWRAKMPKQFYVSPFLAVTDWFDFRVHWLTDRLTVGIHTLDGQTGQVNLVTTFTGKAQPLTTWRLIVQTLKHPWMPAMVIGLIHWHALRLWLKRVPFFSKNDHLNQQQGRLRPR